jgi:S-(hydroxymethyl)glutathione dehydrogenase/alcohol dehydrogenase
VWVRIAAAGVCHSDVSVMDGTIPWPAPSLMGHEGAGIVEEVGPGVTRVKKGDHVVVATVANCGACKWCNIGKPTWCRSSIANRTEPFTVNGVAAGNFAATSSFAEITVIKEIQAVPIPDDVPLTSACLIACGVVTGLGSVFNLADVKPGQTAAVFGAGGVGLSAIQALRIKQASRIIVIDANPAKKDIALQLGGTDFIDAREVEDVSAAVRDMLPHSREMPRGPFAAGGVDWSFECVGHPKVLETAIDITDWGGTTVVVGVPGPDARVSVPITHLTQVDRRIIGSRAGAVRAQHDIPMIVDLYKRGQFDLDSMVSQIYPVANFFDVVHDMHEGKLARGVVTF